MIPTLILLSACQPDRFSLQSEQGEELAGGGTTVSNFSRNAFSFVAPNLKGIEALEFTTGNSFFNQSWVAAVASTTGRDGLGPLFNETSCASCHFKDGRGRTPMAGERQGHGMLFRLSLVGAGPNGSSLIEPTYGGQFNPVGVHGVQGEGDMEITYQEIEGQYADGTSYWLRKPTYALRNLNYGTVDPNTIISPRVANHMIGLGLLEAIDVATIEQWIDEQDADANGISGKANYVDNIETGQKSLGRFGWKAGQPTVRQQVAAAFVGDIGITSSLFPNENHTTNQPSALAAPHGNNSNGYELDDLVLDRVELYSSSLGVPLRRDWESEAVLLGKELFFEIGCQDCHRQKYTTGIHRKFTNLSNQTIYPYTDLLVHDMGEGLADQSVEDLAGAGEWRTPPLWGIGLIEVVNGHTELLHDGRARNIEEAILWHSGEGKNSQEKFKSLTKEERTNLITFIKSL